MEKIQYTKEWLEKTCAESYSLAEVLRKSGRSGGGAQQTLKKKISEFGIDTSHFTGQLWSKGKTATTDPRLARAVENSEKYSLEEVFCKDSPVAQKVLREYLKRHNLIPYVCDNCGCDGNWQGGIISLELDHRNGINNDNELDNLHYLCPNCHALTETYRGKNKKTQISETIPEEEFVEALKTTSNIRQALIKIGLAPAGANYARAKNLIEWYQIVQK